MRDKYNSKLSTHTPQGLKAYMTGKIKIRGDLLLAQQLEQVFEKANGRKVRHCLSLKEWHTLNLQSLQKRAMTFIRENEQLRAALAARNIKAKL